MLPTSEDYLHYDLAHQYNGTGEHFGVEQINIEVMQDMDEVPPVPLGNSQATIESFSATPQATVEPSSRGTDEPDQATIESRQIMIETPLQTTNEYGRVPQATVQSSPQVTYEVAPETHQITVGIPSTSSFSQAQIPSFVKVIPNTPLNIHNLENYVDIVGNKINNIHFIALRFKNPIVIPNNIANSTICIGKDHCIAVNTNHHLKIFSKDGGLVFLLDNLNRMKSHLEFELLKNLFPKQNFLISVFHIRTLYVASHFNPFQTIWRVIQKSLAFRGLVKMLESCVLKTSPFTFEIAAMMRHFRRNSSVDMFKFSNWYPMAQFLCQSNYDLCFYHAPTTEYGKMLFKILKRIKSHQIATNHPPPDFYTCQISLDNTIPVGIACCIVNDRVEFVSPMVVSYTDSWYKDNTYTPCCFSPHDPRPATCRNWFPLMKDKETWLTFGCTWYMNKYLQKMIHLTSIIDWLSIQTTEHYKHMRTDLLQIFVMLYGSVRSRWS